MTSTTGSPTVSEQDYISLALLLAEIQENHPGSEDRKGFNLGDVSMGRHLAKMLLAEPKNERNRRLLAHVIGIRYGPQILEHFPKRTATVYAARREAFRQFSPADRTRVAHTIIFEATQIAGYDGWRIHAQSGQVFRANSWWTKRAGLRFRSPSVATTFAGRGTWLQQAIAAAKTYDVIVTHNDLSASLTTTFEQ